MKEQTSELAVVAKRVLGENTRRTRSKIKRWIREEGYNLPRRVSNGRYEILIADWMERRIVEKRLPRIPRISN